MAPRSKGSHNNFYKKFNTKNIFLGNSYGKKNHHEDDPHDISPQEQVKDDTSKNIAKTLKPSYALDFQTTYFGRVTLDTIHSRGSKPDQIKMFFAYLETQAKDVCLTVNNLTCPTLDPHSSLLLKTPRGEMKMHAGFFLSLLSEDFLHVYECNYKNNFEVIVASLQQLGKKVHIAHHDSPQSSLELSEYYLPGYYKDHDDSPHFVDFDTLSFGRIIIDFFKPGIVTPAFVKKFFAHIEQRMNDIYISVQNINNPTLNKDTALYLKFPNGKFIYLHAGFFWGILSDEIKKPYLNMYQQDPFSRLKRLFLDRGKNVHLMQQGSSLTALSCRADAMYYVQKKDSSCDIHFDTHHFGTIRLQKNTSECTRQSIIDFFVALEKKDHNLLVCVKNIDHPSVDEETTIVLEYPNESERTFSAQFFLSLLAPALVNDQRSSDMYLVLERVLYKALHTRVVCFDYQ